MTYITIDNEDYTMRSTMTVDGDMRDVDRIIYHAIRDRGKEGWTSNSKQRPEAAGWYWVTLDCPGPEERIVYAGGTATRLQRRMYRVVDRMLLAEPGDDSEYMTAGEDPEDYHWVDHTANAGREHVVAWMGPIEPPEVFRGELADGYEYVWE